MQNEPLQVRLAIPGRKEIEQDLLQCISSCDADILEAAISRGHMDILEATEGSIVLQLRPVTDDAVQTLLNAQKNNILFEMISEMLEQIVKDKVMDNEKPVQIRVQVFYAKSLPTTSELQFLIVRFILLIGYTT